VKSDEIKQYFLKTVYLLADNFSSAACYMLSRTRPKTIVTNSICLGVTLLN